MSKYWNVEFGPSYSVKEVLEMGVFGGGYIAEIEGLPSSYYKIGNVLPKGEEPRKELNYYGVMSGMSKEKWAEMGGLTKENPLGFFQWWVKYEVLGIRSIDEDRHQIKRWNSFIRRHMGQIIHKNVLKDKTKHIKQRQGLLNWGWEGTHPVTEMQVKKNALKRANETGCKLVSFDEI